eukprot:4131071-Alexandrium_andersonii.AAC.1
MAVRPARPSPGRPPRSAKQPRPQLPWSQRWSLVQSRSRPSLCAGSSARPPRHGREPGAPTRVGSARPRQS